MCNAFSGIIKKNGKVIWKFGVDSHEELITSAGLRDDTDEPNLLTFARFEITPDNKNYLNPDKWTFRVDQTIRPTWLNEGYEIFCWAEFRKWKKKLNRILVRKLTVNPLSALPPKKITKHHLELLKEWASVWASVGASVWASVRASVGASVWASVRDSVGDSVWASVRDSVRDSVWASVRDSVRDSVWAYAGSLFRRPRKAWAYAENIKRKGYPFQSCVDLWELGLVPSFDGEVWRLHGGKDAKVLWEGKL
jgi:hypothetical protein